MKMVNIEKIGKMAMYLIGSFSIYIASLAAVDFVSILTSQKITSKTQAEQMLEEEKRKLGCKKDITIEILKKSEAKCEKEKNDRYFIELGGFFLDKSSIKHEVYHINDGHLDIKAYRNVLLKPFIYLFYVEPQAIMYQAFGVKL